MCMRRADDGGSGFRHPRQQPGATGTSQQQFVHSQHSGEGEVVRGDPTAASFLRVNLRLTNAHHGSTSRQQQGGDWGLCKGVEAKPHHEVFCCCFANCERTRMFGDNFILLWFPPATNTRRRPTAPSSILHTAMRCARAPTHRWAAGAHRQTLATKTALGAMRSASESARAYAAILAKPSWWLP